MALARQECAHLAPKAGAPTRGALHRLVSPMRPLLSFPRRRAVPEAGDTTSYEFQAFCIREIERVGLLGSLYGWTIRG